MSNWFDIGVNLPDKRLPTEPVIAAAKECGVAAMLLTGTSLQQSQNAFEETQRYKGTLFCTAGFHPHNAKDWGKNSAEQLLSLLSFPDVLAVGECGLDFNRNFSEPEVQLSVFEQQLELAVETQIPIFLHERDAFEQQLTLLKKYRDRIVGGVVHCFTGGPKQVQAYLDLDLHIGITGWVCDEKRGADLRAAVPLISSNYIMLETDAPYLKPKQAKSVLLDQSPRLKSNQPAFLPLIAKKVAELMALELDQLKQSAWNNTLTLFKPNLSGGESGV